MNANAIRLGLLGALTLGLACDSGNEPKKVSKLQPVKPVTGPSPAITATPTPDPTPTPTPAPVAAPTPAPAAGTMTAPGTDADAVDRTRFPDPPWFGADLYPEGKMVQKGHSAPDPDGYFASQMRFDLPEGTTPQQCIDTASERIGKDLLRFEAAKEGDGGRLTVIGVGERYRATLVCGVIDGKSIASVNYRWTSG